ncbi:uncharacterized protein LOC144872492 [Branchiostoma floridae x Branchiostoma japonicum]
MGEKLPGMLLSLLIILKVFGATEAKSCSIRGSTADCRSRSLTSVPQNLPTSITDLVLGNNLIKTLNQSDFSGYGSLVSLWLDNNEISDIQAGTFSLIPQLALLSLDKNKLTNLRSDMFTGLANLKSLGIRSNEISDIQAGTFSTTSKLTGLLLSGNKLTNLRSDMFTGLGNLEWLWLDSNEISDIQAGTFNSTSQLIVLYLHYNRLTVLNAEMFAELSSISVNILNNPELYYLTGINITNNPWQCDCRMLPFRQKMTGYYLFENQITCEGPSNFHGQNLQDISPEDLICEKPVNALPVLVGSICGAVIGSVLVVTIVLTIWRKWRYKIPHSGSNSDEEEYDDVITLSQRPHTDKDTDHLGMIEDEYEVIPPSLPPRNTSGPLGDNQTVTATVHGVENPQVVMDEDGYVLPKDDPQSHKYANSQVTAASNDAETVVQVIVEPDDYLSFVVTEKDQPHPNKYQNSQMVTASQDAVASPQVVLEENDESENDDPQSNKYENSQVTAASNDAETVVQVIVEPDDYLSFVVTEKDQPHTNKYQQSQMVAVPQDAGPLQHVILYDNENGTVKDDPRSHKYENSDVIASAILAVSPVILDEDDDKSTKKDDPLLHKYENSQMIAAAIDAVAAPQVAFSENDQSQTDNQNDPAAVHGADNTNHYQQLRKETLEQQHTYTSLQTHDDKSADNQKQADNQTQADNQNDPAAVHGADNTNHYQQLRKETLEQQHTYTSLQTHDQ